jgi:hypothetical protein
MHPLSPDLTALKDDELHKKIADLTSRLTQAYRFGGYEVAGQIHMLLDDYQAEASRRHQRMMEELAAKTDKFDGIIDIK